MAAILITWSKGKECLLVLEWNSSRYSKMRIPFKMSNNEKVLTKWKGHWVQLLNIFKEILLNLYFYIYLPFLAVFQIFFICASPNFCMWGNERDPSERLGTTLHASLERICCHIGLDCCHLCYFQETCEQRELDITEQMAKIQICFINSKSKFWKEIQTLSLQYFQNNSFRLILYICIFCQQIYLCQD